MRILFALWACSPELSEEDTEAECLDLADNDQDGLVDCMEPGCAPFCGATPTGHTGAADTDTDTDADTDTDTDADSDTAEVLPHFTGALIVGGAGIAVGLGADQAISDAKGAWDLSLPPGTYAWTLTPTPGSALMPVATVIHLVGDRHEEVALATGGLPTALGGNGVQPTTGLYLDLPDELVPPLGQPATETLRAALMTRPLPVDEASQVLRMYTLEPVGHAGEIGLAMQHPPVPGARFWALDPASGRWVDLGVAVQEGTELRSPTPLPWLTTVVLVVP